MLSTVMHHYKRDSKLRDITRKEQVRAKLANYKTRRSAPTTKSYSNERA